MIWAVLGGDMRMVELANRLAREGEQVRAFGFDTAGYFHPSVLLCGQPEEAVKEIGVAILPLPVSRDKTTLFAPFSATGCSMAQLFALFPRDCQVFGGKVSPTIREQAAEYGFAVGDYLEREEFAVANAVPTAEGAIQLAMEQLHCTLASTNCLITGYGRVAKVLAELLAGLHTKVTVCARSVEQRTWSQVSGHACITPAQLPELVRNYNLIFNTVPARILPEKLLSTLAPDTLLIELASEPGGFDLPLATRMGLHVLSAQSLPGKVAPVTGGSIILDTVRNMLAESKDREA